MEIKKLVASMVDTVSYIVIVIVSLGVMVQYFDNCGVVEVDVGYQFVWLIAFITDIV